MRDRDDEEPDADLAAFVHARVREHRRGTAEAVPGDQEHRGDHRSPAIGAQQDRRRREGHDRLEQGRGERLADVDQEHVGEVLGVEEQDRVGREEERMHRVAGDRRQLASGQRGDRRGRTWSVVASLELQGLECTWHDGRSEPNRPPGGAHVGVIIIREMVGTSPKSWSDAARQAVATASKTVRNIQTVEVVKSSAVVADGEIVEYRVEVKIGFEYEG